MAFGVTREELNEWKQRVARGDIAYLTHYWLDPRFPGAKTVTKVGCSDLSRLTSWCREHGLDPKYIHNRSPFPHFDLIGPKQREILQKEGLWTQLERFNLIGPPEQKST
ncbi:hypothetical protein [Paenibacillus macerans]|uniref:hypothetical protein n=1 Tax=Paenibacillus macerans TaxID=44252 RepID=UPI00203C691C|nr:hypothetical protein [Paenibacillus macerans]MCM3702858.1 hypothetical protein [Paenibacillus macerans]